MKRRIMKRVPCCLLAGCMAVGMPNAAAVTASAEESHVGELAFAKCEEYINIRSAADTQSEVTGKIYNYGAVTIQGEEGDWYQITSGNASGYVRKEYFATGDEADQIAAQVAYHVASVHPEELYVRSTPGEDGSVIGSVYQSDELAVVNYTGDWMSVVTSDGLYGYVNAYYVDYNTYYPVAETLEEEQNRIQAQQGSPAQDISLSTSDTIWNGSGTADGTAGETDANAAGEAGGTADGSADANAGENAADGSTDAGTTDAVPETSAPETDTGYTPETSVPETSAPETDAGYTPETYAPETSAPETEPETYAPETSAPETEPETYAPETYAPETYAPETEPETYAPETYAPETEPETYAPETSAPETEPETYAPETDAPVSSGLGQQIADYAVQFVGNPYVYGGTSLTGGADCSGFTLSVFANFGIGLSRTAASQSGGGTSVSLDSLQAGDLLFYSDGSGISHVGIYIGGGMIVHAANEATGITISSAYYSTPVCASRYWG